MQIPINKDIEEAYRNEAVQGFTIREACYIVTAIVVMIGLTIVLYLYTDLSPDICIFITVPVGIPILFIGFKKFQGMNAIPYLREIIYSYRTRILTYDADELPDEYHEFTMERKVKKGKGWWTR